MFLGKLGIDYRHPSIRQALRDRQDMHRNLSHAYDSGILYRIIEKKQESEILVLSHEMPNQDELEARGYHLIDIQDLSLLPEKYKEGAVLHFNLLASPSKKVKREGNSRRVFLSAPEQRADWLRKQGSKYGFDVLEVYEPSAVQKMTVGRRTGQFHLSALELSGVIRIRDAVHFWNAWEKGVGPEKAYGLGLMLLSR